MSFISSITKGREARPPRIMIYGSEGIGKSTFAALVPNPVFVQTEDGLSEIDCSKFPLGRASTTSFSSFRRCATSSTTTARLSSIRSTGLSVSCGTACAPTTA